MLIKSRRHTKADLELWSDWEDTYREIAASKDLAHKIGEAIGRIREIAERKSFVSVSWGKDSVLLAYLAYQADQSLPLVWLKESPMHNPECELVRDAFLAEYPMRYHEFVIDYSTVGFDPFLNANGDSILFHQIGEAVRQSFGLRITGMRADESGRRLVMMRHHGLETKNAAAPLGWWTWDEVMAATVSFDLPIHPAYAMLGGGRYDARNIRVDCLAGKQGNWFGRAEWEREYYPDVLARLGV